MTVLLPLQGVEEHRPAERRPGVSACGKRTAPPSSEEDVVTYSDTAHFLLIVQRTISCQVAYF